MDMKIKHYPIGDLISAEYNPRQLTKDQFSQLKDSVKRFGLVDPIIVNTHKDRKNIVVGGHQRIKVADALKIDKIPCVEVKLNLEKERELNIRLNKNLGEWDYDNLANFFDMDDLKDWGFSDADLQLFDIEDVASDGLTDDDEVPEVEEAITQTGDLWMLGDHKVLCGDATKKEDVELLMDGNKADMVFTDPPYGYSYESNYQNKHKMLMNDDAILDFLPVCKTVMSDCSTIYICTSHQTIDKWKPLVESVFDYKNLIVWKKNNWSMGDLSGSFAGQHEIILFASIGKQKIIGNRDTDIWEFNREPPKLHPTMKPVELIEYGMSKWQSGKVLDPFLGSGSTLIACEKTNRKCYGMEIDPHYCDVIVKRWEDYTGKTAKLLELETV